MLLGLSLFCILFQELLCPAGASDNGIIGGTVAKAHSRPYMASIQVHGHHVCGGFLIREDFVLTAAHCLSNKCKEVIVLLGGNNISIMEKFQQRIPAKKCLKHPGNALDKYDFDLMLIQLAHNASLNKNVKTIELPNKGENLPENTECLMSGWGETKPNSSAGKALLDVYLKVQSSEECKKIWQVHFSPRRMLCTHFNGKRGICRGDSGGPLVFKNKAYGIAAFTGQPCTQKYPNVYMKTSFFITWITKTMKQI